MRLTVESVLWAKKVLGVGEKTNYREIKKAYLYLANKYHPDKGGSRDEFEKIKKAYEILKQLCENYMISLEKSSLKKQLPSSHTEKWFDSI